jgi:hypothetical protein
MWLRTDRWQVLVNTLMHIQVSQEARRFFLQSLLSYLQEWFYSMELVTVCS